MFSNSSFLFLPKRSPSMQIWSYHSQLKLSNADLSRRLHEGLHAWSHLPPSPLLTLPASHLGLYELPQVPSIHWTSYSVLSLTPFLLCAMLFLFAILAILFSRRVFLAPTHYAHVPLPPIGLFVFSLLIIDWNVHLCCPHSHFLSVLLLSPYFLAF